MKFRFGAIALFLLMVAAASAKPDLPFRLSNDSTGGGRASVTVTFVEGATNVTVTARATGSAVMPPVTRRLRKVAKGEKLELSPIETSQGSFGGVAVHVQGDFGSGSQAQARTLTLTSAPASTSRVRSQGAGQPPARQVIVLPSKTTVRPIER